MTREEKRLLDGITPVNANPKFSSSTNTCVKPKIQLKPSTSALVICRNKHWKYISSFHGPWLQLPPEVLESLAYNNFDSLRPRPIDPTIFFDLVRIRRLVEEATDLAVRAANGTTSSSLGSLHNASNRTLGIGANAAIGLGVGPDGPYAKLSRERRHRMRENATQKLSQAYQMDEVAASVAVMQGASPLEEVAKLVLQRNPSDIDAKYVHFFHEKIPSRMLSTWTNLQPLDEVILERPTEGAPLRTRALIKMFKEDYAGAVHDLSEGLAVCRCSSAQHQTRSGQLKLANALGDPKRLNGGGGGKDLSTILKNGEADRRMSLEAQLLFHRGGAYLALACQSVSEALDDCVSDEALKSQQSSAIEPARLQRQKRCLEACRMVKTNAKKALRDILSFLSHFDYTIGLPSEVNKGLFRNASITADDLARSRSTTGENNPLETSRDTSLENDFLSDALIHNFEKRDDHKGSTTRGDGDHMVRTQQIYPISALFSASPPTDLPPYPATSKTLVSCSSPSQNNDLARFAPNLLEQSQPHEAVTYHPLLIDALHSLLLCHSLIQTSSKEHLRHSHMVARLVRICDGYPIFLTARSPSRADWIEVVHRAKNWIGLQQSWETLCAPAPLLGQSGQPENQNSVKPARERRYEDAIAESLANERAHDEGSRRTAIPAHDLVAEEQRDEALDRNSELSKRWAQEDSTDYPLGTSRAEAISRWVIGAPSRMTAACKRKNVQKKIEGDTGKTSLQVER